MKKPSLDKARAIGPSRFLPLLLGCLLLGPPAATNAEDVALLMGVGSYQDPAHDLPGIDKDLELMRTLAKRLGFRDADIRTLVKG